MKKQFRIISFLASGKGLVIAALLVRLAGLLVVDIYTDAPNRLFHESGTAGEYPQIARHVIAGEGFRYHVLEGVAVRSAYTPPGYAYYLAGTFALLGEGLTCFIVIQFLHALAGTAVCWTTYKLGQLAVSKSTGLLAGYICAFYPTHVFASVVIHPAPLYILLNLLILLLILRAEPRYWSKKIIPAGLLQGLLILFRPQTILYAVLLGICLAGRTKSKARYLGPVVFLTLAAAVVAPWTIRNYVVFNRFIPVTTTTGYNIWRGQNDLPPVGYVCENVSRNSLRPESSAEFASVPRDDRFEPARDKLYLKWAIEYIKADPGRAMINAVRKVGLFWGYNPYHKRGREPLVWAPWIVVAPMFIVGLVYSAIKKMVPWIFYAYPIVHTVLAAMFLCLPRYRMLIEPIIFIFAAVGIILIYQKLKPSGTVSEQT